MEKLRREADSATAKARNEAKTAQRQLKEMEEAKAELEARLKKDGESSKKQRKHGKAESKAEANTLSRCIVDSFRERRAGKIQRGLTMVKKVIFALINFLSIAIIAAAVAVLCIVLMTKPGKAPSVLGYTVLRVTTGSMAPTYEVDTLIVVKKTDPAEIREGDVISFYSLDPALDGAVNTHRVVSRKKRDGYIYQTKGDANNAANACNLSIWWER